MGLPTTGFSATGIEETEWGEFTSAWSLKFMDELSGRKYAEGFNPKFTAVLNWAFAHRKKIENMPFDEQEQLMIKDGVLTENDIKDVA